MEGTSGWSCLKCTFKNKQVDSICAMCNEPFMALPDSAPAITAPLAVEEKNDEVIYVVGNQELPMMQQIINNQPQIIHAQPQIIHAQPQIIHAQPQIIHAQPQIINTPPQIIGSQHQIIGSQQQVVYPVQQTSIPSSANTKQTESKKQKNKQLFIGGSLLAICIVVVALIFIILSTSGTFKSNNTPTPATAPTTPSPTYAGVSGDAIPGVHYMSKAYNILSGKEIYEQIGHDIIDYQWNGIIAHQTDDKRVYEIPIEFKNIPPVSSSCTSTTSSSSVSYSSSSSIWSSNYESNSGGYSQTSTVYAGINLGIFSIGAETEITNSVLYGSSSTSFHAKESSKSGSAYSFSLFGQASLYTAVIDWENNNEFKFKNTFINDIIQLNNNPSNQAILSFFKSWGTHVMSTMETGAFCKKTIHSTSCATYSQMTDYSKKESSLDVQIMFAKYNHEEKNEKGNVTTDEKYSFSYSSTTTCQGQVDVTSLCGDIFGDENQPIPIEYDLFPIWEISQLKNNFSDLTIERIETFFTNIYDALNTCKNNNCNSHGVCTLDIDNSWDGNTFSKLLNNDGGSYFCFCQEGYYGNDCSSTEPYSTDNGCGNGNSPTPKPTKGPNGVSYYKYMYSIFAIFILIIFFS